MRVHSPVKIEQIVSAETREVYRFRKERKEKIKRSYFSFHLCQAQEHQIYILHGLVIGDLGKLTVKQDRMTLEKSNFWFMRGIQIFHFNQRTVIENKRENFFFSQMSCTSKYYMLPFPQTNSLQGVYHFTCSGLVTNS